MPGYPGDEEPERNLDFGKPADPRDLWPRLKPPQDCPVIWKVDSGGVPQECRVLGHFDGAVVVATAAHNQAQKTADNQWFVSLYPPGQVFLSENEAALHGLTSVHATLLKMTETLTKITGAAAKAKK